MDARTAPPRLPALLLPLLAGCGPTQLTDNIEQPGPISGPFAVSRFFSASGFMGDGELPRRLTADVDSGCKARPVGARGNCYRFVYTPDETRWAGVYWQFPANNWGSRPGRAIDARFSRVSFQAAAEFSVQLPEGGANGAVCSADDACRPGLVCTIGVCANAGQTALGQPCLVSGECANAAQCAGQVCVEAGAGLEADGCGEGFDERCASGLRCGLAGNVFRCLVEGTGDVGNACASRNDCQAGLYCEGSECTPKTRSAPFTFQVGGIAPTKAGLEHSDEIGVGYFALPGEREAVLTPDLQPFSIDLSRVPEFHSLIGAFMWATAFPDIDLVSEQGNQAYLADASRPMRLFFDDIFFETD